MAAGQLVAVLGVVKTTMANKAAPINKTHPGVRPISALPGALTEAIARTCPGADLCCSDLGRHPGDVEAAVYFCCLEALQNAAKHAGANVTVQVELAERDGELSFAVRDDGAGFDASYRVRRCRRSSAAHDMRVVLATIRRSVGRPRGHRGARVLAVLTYLRSV